MSILLILYPYFSPVITSGVDLSISNTDLSNPPYIFIFLNPIFWITVFVILLPYYKIKNNNIKNALLVIFSISWYIWYTKEVSIYLVSTIVNTWVYGKIFEKNIKSKFMKYFFWIIGIGINLGVLLVLKYNGLMFGRNLGFAVPLGLSFYTFQAIGYCIDIRNGVCRP